MTVFQKTQHIVVVGAGYAGLPLALKLGFAAQKAQPRSPLRISVLNREPRQELTCELFRTLRTGEAEFLNFSKHLKSVGVNFIEGTVSLIDPLQKELLIHGAQAEKVSYDALVICSGLKPYLPPLEGLAEALESSNQEHKRVFLFRNNAQAQSLRLALKRLKWSPEPIPGQARDHFVIVLGGGSTGLEVAGEIAAMRGKNSRARVVLVDDKKDLLKEFSPVARRVLKSELARFKIETVLGSPASKITPQELLIANGQVIPWDLLVVCTGAKASANFLKNFGDRFSERGLEVDSFLQISGFNDHYAAGDVALIPKPHHPLGNRFYVSHTAQFAQQEGIFLAERLIQKYLRPGTHKEKAFETSDWGYFMSLGPTSGLGRLGSEGQGTLQRFFSPFIFGPLVDKLKWATRLKYFAQIEKYARFG